jgi:phosphoribosylaminoimidazole carboxylase PurE protein
MKEPEGQDRVPVVGIVMGSDSDWGVMQKAASILKQLDIDYDVTVASAHRSPKRTTDYARSARERGLKVIIAGAGAAAHLAGAIAAHTSLPIIGVPIDSSPLKGLDALLSTVQMPSGVPVATVAVGAAGAKNAAILAAQILATGDPEILAKLEGFKKKLATQVAKKAEALRQKL